MEEAIRVENLDKYYKLYSKPIDRFKEAISYGAKAEKYSKQFQALNNVNLSIKSGEAVGIIGLNGSGKSTLLKIISGIIKPTNGTVHVSGNVAALLELGAGFNPDFTGLENVYHYAKLYGLTEKDVKLKLDQILDFAEIGDFIDQPVKTYSSGMFVRLAFSVVINLEPDILIVDEALSVGDVFFQQKCYKKIKSMIGKTTILFVSHDLNAVTKICDRVIVLSKGQVIYEGDPLNGVSAFHKLKQGDRSLRNIKNGDFQNVEMKAVNSDILSGRMDALINFYSYSVEEEPFADSIFPGYVLAITIGIESSRTIDNPIIGYQVRDKYGTDIFGENTITSEIDGLTIMQGYNEVSFELLWPEVREGDYFVTIGIGEGYEVLNQVEQCWANNLIHFKCINGSIVYGVFNQKIQGLTIECKGV